MHLNTKTRYQRRGALGTFGRLILLIKFSHIHGSVLINLCALRPLVGNVSVKCHEKLSIVLFFISPSHFLALKMSLHGSVCLLLLVDLLDNHLYFYEFEEKRSVKRPLM